MAKSIDVFSTAQAFAEDELKGCDVAVIDVLRTGSSITTALVNGAKSVIPVADMGEASKIAGNLDARNYLLCGEHNGYRIDGYQIGNSPNEFSEEKVKDKTLILNTSNGSGAIRRSHLGSKVMVATFLNMERVITELRESQKDIILICAGTRNRLAIEDLLCAGAIIHGLLGGKLHGHETDGAKVAFSLFEKFGENIEYVIRNSNHGEWLVEKFGDEDLVYCSQKNIYPVLPVLKEGVIKLADGI